MLICITNVLIKIIPRWLCLEPACRPAGFPISPPLWGGQNCFFAILGGAKYKISVFGPKDKMKPAKPACRQAGTPTARLGDSRFQEIFYF